MDAEWRKATASSGNNGCVEVRFKDGMIEVRDTKSREAGTLRFTPEEWMAFTEGTRAGEFDL